MDNKEIFNQSHHFKRPTETNGLKALNLDDLNTLSLTSSARTIIHEDVLPLCLNFLAWKRERGSWTEKEVYRDISLIEFLQRLIANRPQSFFGRNDRFLLRNGESGSDKWDRIGEEDAPKMEDYMTYDEVKLAAFVQASARVKPINQGDRFNKGKVTANHINEAIYVGAVGARLKRQGRMEYQEMVIDPKQNTEERGYGKRKRNERSLQDVFAEFYGRECLPTYEEAAKDRSGDHIKLSKLLFNAQLYRRRIEIGAETFLLEANDRGEARMSFLSCAL